MKNKLYQSGDLILRILDSKNDELLVIDCVKQTMPIWKLASDITNYKLISEEDLLNKIECLLEFESLDANQIRVMHNRYTMIASIISYIGDDKIRSRKIAEVSEEYRVSKQSIRKHLCKYLVYKNILVLAPKKKDTNKELSIDEKNMRWGLNKFFYTQKKNSRKR